ncbi:MAG: ATP-dependent zinc metalloprotease FtsH [Planctomycetes bacterium]|nr:ATP-dependent zinc metalloprotease FtsH [Planctomycetota bacterium]
MAKSNPSNSSGSSPKPSGSGNHKGRSDRGGGLNIVMYVIIVLVVATAWHLYYSKPPSDEITAGELENRLDPERDPKGPKFSATNVAKLTIGEKFITVETLPDLRDKPGAEATPESGDKATSEARKELARKYIVPIVGIADVGRERLRQLAEKQGIRVSYERPPSEIALLISWVSVLALGLLIFFFILRRTGGAGSALSFGRSRGRMHAQEDLDVTFEHVAGNDEAVEELREIVEFLRSPGKYQALGGRIPRGVLLVGPPGTGKTLLAKAIAGEAGVPFFSLSGSDFVEMFVGVGAARVRDMFSQAASRSPSIIFIDELDALGKVRGSGYPGGHDEREQTLNALLVEMDGFSSDQSVIVLAATNRPETLDPALMRPGRFDRHVLVDRPDIKGREAILKVHVGKIKVDDNVDLKHVAKLTPGFVGADLANLVNEAALLAARKNKNRVTVAEFEEGIERVVAGLEKQTRIIPPEEKKRVAFHECGHALVACSLPNTDPVHKISIIPRGLGALGYMRQAPTDERNLITQSELESRICVMLGGITTEQIVYNEISTGAQNDLERATDIARRMVMEFGMSPKLGRVNYRDSGRNPFAAVQFTSQTEYSHSEQTLREIDLEVKRIIDHAAQTAYEVLTTKREILDHLARELVEKEVMDAEQIYKIIDEHKTVPQLKPGTNITSLITADPPVAESVTEKPGLPPASGDA